ncbi:MAG: MFS transporter [Prevotellaceae bacterium]|jgi:EmrB/QacA subfamily drug resistance transporter|nr:MFS transporter [Prevotellaceae bacterium]
MPIDTSSKTYKNWVLLVVCLSSSLVPFMGSSINLALPHIARDFSLHSVQQSWILTAYLLSSAILQVPFGRLADIWGKRNVYMIGLGVFTIATIFCGYAFNGTSLIILRALQGVGSAMIFSTSMAIISSVFAPKERGVAMGINAATVYLAAAAGPSFGGFITQGLGWEYIFTITAGIALLSLIGSFVVMKDRWAEAKGEPFDMRGSIIYGLAIMALIYGLTILPQILGIGLIVASAILFMVFVKREHKEKYPVFNVNFLFGNKVFRMSSTAALINYAATFPIGFLISLYLQEVKGLDPRTAGLVLIVQPAIQAVLSPLAGKLSDKIQPRYLASGGMALITVILLAIAWFISPTTPISVILVMLSSLGVGFAAFSSPNTNAIMGSVEKRYYSMASATTGTMRLTGQAFSMGITTMIISIIIGKQAITPEVSAELMNVIHVTFIIFAVLCAFGVYTSMARGSGNNV